MGRQLKRVALDFSWPINTPWQGYINPHHAAAKCAHCDGTGYSPTARHLSDQWYGYASFRPEDRGSTPHLPTYPVVLAFAKRNVERTPGFYGSGEAAIVREAKRLVSMWNKQWCHHLSAEDVTALVKAGRLYDLTHIWTEGRGWQPKDPPYTPSPQEVNDWSMSGMGHDGINRCVCIAAECDRLGVSKTCAHCSGDGETWPSAEEKKRYDDWTPTEPPVGDGYQIWETVSEGSPISPVFSTPEDLANHMATTRWGGDRGTPYETWLAFVRGPGWAPSMVVTNGRAVDGVTAVSES